MSIILMLIVFILTFYFMIIYPQQKQEKERKRLINAIETGDEILTSSGFIGKVIKVKDSGYIYILLNESTEAIIKRDFVTAILPKGTIKEL